MNSIRFVGKGVASLGLLLFIIMSLALMGRFISGIVLESFEKENRRGRATRIPAAEISNSRANYSGAEKPILAMPAGTPGANPGLVRRIELTAGQKVRLEQLQALYRNNSGEISTEEMTRYGQKDVKVIRTFLLWLHGAAIEIVVQN